MLGFRKLILRSALSLIVLLLVSGRSSGDTNVLFVGNSYTYYNSMPQIFKAMAENLYPEQSFEVKFIGGGGATLKKHWEVGQALAEIQTGKWDFVVLQEQSSLGSKNLKNSKSWGPFYNYSRKFAEVIKKHGGTTVFFMTWSRRDSRPQQRYLTTAYQTIARELESPLAPVGLVWDSIREHEGIDLFLKDGSHPSVEGSFLAALTLYGTIFDTIPSNTSGKLEGYEILRGGALAPEKSLLSDLPAVDVLLMEKAVAKQLR